MRKSVNIHGRLRTKVRSVDRELQEGRGSPATKQAFDIFHLTLKELHLTVGRGALREVQGTMHSRISASKLCTKGPVSSRAPTSIIRTWVDNGNTDADTFITSSWTLKLETNKQKTLALRLGLTCLQSGEDSGSRPLQRGRRRKPLTSPPDTT